MYSLTAATAITHKLTVVTRNVKDIERCSFVSIADILKTSCLIAYYPLTYQPIPLPTRDLTN